MDKAEPDNYGDNLPINLKKKFTDFTLRAAGEEFKVHKLILCAQSEYFTQNIAILQHDPQTVEAMILFMYGFGYNSRDRAISPMRFDAKLYSAAEFYGVPVLKQLAKANFAARARIAWDADDFLDVITEVYTSTVPTDRGLRNILVETAKKNICSLLLKDNFVSKLEECGSFSADILRLVVSGVLPSPCSTW
ncbi:hypothetical protein ACJ72_06561 [Emergomyces africanus]|uniref:BTB domain-containing protein n=1 Tax=Emergomyces africanus TaxID=1955775 RepID=A0A1B7NQM1_9EURO|nr:hypothetical protein ACJ72_06561 [Emergomyces africanus]